MVPPIPYDQVSAVITSDLGAPPESVFARFDSEPLASASIAQVHTAQLLDGEEVVVKVQRPGIRERLEGDLRIFLQQPKEEVRLTPGQTYAVPPKRPHLVTNAGDTSAVFLVLQGIGEYDFVPLT